MMLAKVIMCMFITCDLLLYDRHWGLETRVLFSLSWIE